MYRSGTGERIYAFLPSLFPVYVELTKDNLDRDLTDRAVKDLQVAISASGIAGEANITALDRARRAANILIRDHAFGGAVVAAYDSLCSMCGIDTGLVVGAHIMPVEAPNSPDRVWNGLALCQNHHAIFDQHKLWVQPSSRALVYHPDVLRQATNSALRAFVDTTFKQLAEPTLREARPREEMFQNRYEFYGSSYAWTA
jgi:predicted restriction endonuclease